MASEDVGDVPQHGGYPAPHHLLRQREHADLGLGEPRAVLLAPAALRPLRLPPRAVRPPRFRRRGAGRQPRARLVGVVLVSRVETETVNMVGGGLD